MTTIESIEGIKDVPFVYKSASSEEGKIPLTPLEEKTVELFTETPLSDEFYIDKPLSTIQATSSVELQAQAEERLESTLGEKVPSSEEDAIRASFLETSIDSQLESLAARLDAELAKETPDRVAMNRCIEEMFFIISLSVRLYGRAAEEYYTNKIDEVRQQAVKTKDSFGGKWALGLTILAAAFTVAGAFCPGEGPKASKVAFTCFKKFSPTFATLKGISTGLSLGTKGFADFATLSSQKEQMYEQYLLNQSTQRQSTVQGKGQAADSQRAEILRKLAELQQGKHQQMMQL